MTWHVSRSFMRLFIALFLSIASFHSLSICFVEQGIDAPLASVMHLKAGEQRLRLTCNVSGQHVLYFCHRHVKESEKA